MVAAYAVALQMLFTGMVVGDLAAAAPANDPFVICFGSHHAPSDDQQPASPPAHHQNCVLCSLATAAAAILPGVASDIRRPGPGISVRWAPFARLVVVKHSTPRLSQGPPQRA